MDGDSSSHSGSLWLYVALIAGVVVAVLVIRDRWPLFAPAGETPEAGSVAVPPASSAPPPPRARPPDEVRWLAFGGGAEPASNQVSMEQDLALAGEVFGAGAGLMLYAGGAGRSPVQVLAESPPPDLRLRLGELFDPRDGRQARYRATTLAPHGDATVANVRRALRDATNRSGEPLVVFVAAHGEAGPTPRDNYLTLWGAEPLSVSDIADIAQRSRRALRFVITSCFSGGFAEMAFVDADPKRGRARSDHCGLFASTWDSPASGCDPNPDRRAQESYGLHFLNALRRSDRSGRNLPIGDVDLDGDGAVSLLEAHASVRMASQSLSVPTTTSERWLRETAAASGPEADVLFPEELRVVEVLQAKLSVRDAADAQKRYDALTARADHADEQLASLERKADIHYNTLRIALLERWAVLDDPYHPDYADALRRDGAAISDYLDHAPISRDYHDAQAASHRARAALDALDIEAALFHRLVRAYETLGLARRLAAKGGADWEHYQRLLACERTVPVR